MITIPHRPGRSGDTQSTPHPTGHAPAPTVSRTALAAWRVSVAIIVGAMTVVIAAAQLAGTADPSDPPSDRIAVPADNVGDTH